MDEQLLRKLIRQLKFLNFWITTFGILLLAALGIIGYLLFQMIGFIRETSNQVQQFQQSTTENLDVRQQACEDQGSLGKFVRRQGNICD